MMAESSVETVNSHINEHVVTVEDTPESQGTQEGSPDHQNRQDDVKHNNDQVINKKQIQSDDITDQINQLIFARRKVFDLIDKCNRKIDALDLDIGRLKLIEKLRDGKAVHIVPGSEKILQDHKIEFIRVWNPRNNYDDCMYIVNMQTKTMTHYNRDGITKAPYQWKQSWAHGFLMQLLYFDSE